MHYEDTDSLYSLKVENKQWDDLDEAALLFKALIQGENESKDGEMFYGLFLTPRLKYCLTIKKFGGVDEHKTPPIVYYTDCDSLYIENKHWNKLAEAGLVGKNLLQGKNDYKDGGIFYGLFLAPKIKYCLTINKYGVIDEYKTFKCFTNVSDNLDRKEHFKMLKDDKVIAKVPLCWKKSFSMGAVITQKMRDCNKCSKDILCDGFGKLVHQNKQFSANLNEFKRKLPNEFSHMVPEYKTM